MNQTKKKRTILLQKRDNQIFVVVFFSYRTLTTEHNSNSNDSIDDALENNSDKRPQYKNIMNNIRRGIRTDDETASNRKVTRVSFIYFSITRINLLL